MKELDTKPNKKNCKKFIFIFYFFVDKKKEKEKKRELGARKQLQKDI